MKVSIWGEVKLPGLYSIPDGTDLATLLSLAGGPSEGANLSRVKVIRSFPTPSAIVVDMGDFFNTGNREKLPIMKPGDMVRINKTFYTKFKDSLHNLAELTLLLGISVQLYNIWKTN
ncbi:MAG: SLBB domain-containing protein [Candidatus Stahlbacteria bacterium]|nr:SLBB domain-containing protein [Candidatus Stahlbacteria bacterium]